MVINRVIKRVPNRFFRTWDLYYLTGRDLGFQSKTGTRFKTKSVHRMLEAKNIHRDYGILNKNWGWDDVGKSREAVAHVFQTTIHTYKFDQCRDHFRTL